MKLPQSEILAECLRLQALKPNWDWSRCATNVSKQVKAAHFALWTNYLSQRVEFNPSLQAPPTTESFLEKWAKRAPGISVTSDHLMTTNTFSTEDGINLKISTFNLGNKFHSKAKCHTKDSAGNGLYSNNPEDMDETNEQYLARKHQQIDDIVAHLKQEHGTYPITPVDALFLQEIDFLISKERNKKALKKEFLSVLWKNGYCLKMTTPALNAIPQAIIYRNDVLEPEAMHAFSGHIPGTTVGGKKVQNTLFEGRFILLGTDKKVCLASAHLDYEGDYSNELIKYATARAKEGYTTIWGGDTNHAPNYDIQGLIGDCNFATNYDLSTASGELTTLHGNTTAQKTYDGFGGSAPEGIRLTVTEESPRLCFDKTTNGGLTVRQVHQHEINHCVHTSLPGRPWQKRQSLVLDTLGFREKIINVICSEQSNEAQTDQAYNVIKSSPTTGIMLAQLQEVDLNIPDSGKRLFEEVQRLARQEGETELIQRLQQKESQVRVEGSVNQSAEGNPESTLLTSFTAFFRPCIISDHQLDSSSTNRDDSTLVNH